MTAPLNQRALLGVSNTSTLPLPLLPPLIGSDHPRGLHTGAMQSFISASETGDKLSNEAVHMGVV